MNTSKIKDILNQKRDDCLAKNICESTNVHAQYFSNEKLNHHSQNVLLMAKAVGDENDVKQAQDILDRHLKRRYISDTDYLDRVELAKKLRPKFKKLPHDFVIK